VNAALAALGPVRTVVRTAGPGYFPDTRLSGMRDRAMRDPELVARAASAPAARYVRYEPVIGFPEWSQLLTRNR